MRNINTSKTIIRICAIISGISGFVFLMAVVLPIAMYQSESRQNYPRLVSPLSDTYEPKQGQQIDYTKASNWFESDPASFGASDVGFYTISVPKLGIENATVAIGGEDLTESLIHFPGTGVPGKRNGNSVIFGHSILPIFYNPKDYLAIFSTLNKLDDGDEVFVDYDGVTYLYVVNNKFEVLPTDVRVLDQGSGGSHISLITCTPPGDPRKPKRLVVRATLVPQYTADATTGN